MNEMTRKLSSWLVGSEHVELDSNRETEKHPPLRKSTHVRAELPPSTSEVEKWVLAGMGEIVTYYTIIY